MLTINSKHETCVQRHMGGFLAARSCPQRIHSFYVLVDCVIAQFESQQDKLNKAEHFQLLWSDSSRFLSEDSRAMWHTAAGAVSGKHVVSVHSSRSNRQQLAPGEWRWTGHIHNLHKNVTGKRLTNHMDPCRGSPKDGLLYYASPSDGFLKEMSVHCCVFLARPTERSKGIAYLCGVCGNMKNPWALTCFGFLSSEFLG